MVAKAKSPLPAQTGTLAQRIAQAPRLASPTESRAKVKEWLIEIASSKAGKALERIMAASPKVRAMLEGLADGSPYLWDLIVASPERWVTLLESDPDARIVQLLEELNRESKTTIILVTHDHALAGHAQRIIRLSDGRVVSDTSTERAA